MKHLFPLVLCTLSLFACAKKQSVQMNELPQDAQTILNQYCVISDIASFMMEKEIADTDYIVYFKDGSKWEFGKNGEIESIESTTLPVPSDLIPSAILSYVNQTYAGQFIMEYSVDRNEYEVKLSSGIELTFNKSFQLTETDRD